jgi:2-polyprenyl-6-methoxyphenol hydroxylase-like FAD-dependent oxidoreductase
MRVAIAGFGIGGAALSIALARDGHEVTVYERAPDPGPVGAGFDSLVIDIVTGMLDDQTPFKAHGQTLRFQVTTGR